MTPYASLVAAAWSQLLITLGFRVRVKPSLVFRSDGSLSEQKAPEPFCLSSPGQQARLYNIRAAGLDKDRKQVS